jgi:glutathione S-transferase
VRALSRDGAWAARPDDPERIDWLIWVHFAETLSQHIATLTQQHIVLREDHMRSPVLMKIEAKRARNATRPSPRGSRGGTYLLDGGFSAADVSVGQAVYMARHFVRTEPFAALQAWYDRITARPGFIASLPVEDEDRLYTRDYYEPWEVT